MNVTEQQTLTPSHIRSDLIDTAISFLKNPKVIRESLEKKRAFLQKKGLTENEIDYAFKIIPQNETNKEIVSYPQQPSFLRRFFSDLILAALLGYAFKFVQRWFRSKHSGTTNELSELIKNLQKTVQDLQKSVTKLEQAADQLHLSSLHGPSSPIEEIKREIQIIKGLSLNRSQFPSIPQFPTRLPSWQLEAAEKNRNHLSSVAISTDETNPTSTQEDNKEDCDSIVVIPDHDKKSDDEHQISTSPSSESANEI